MSRTTFPVSQIGHSYSGVSLGLGTFCSLPKAYKEADVSEPFAVPLMIISTPIIIASGIIDLGLSFAIDTMMLPYDLLTEPEYERISLKQDCEHYRSFMATYAGPIPNRLKTSNQEIGSELEE